METSLLLRAVTVWLLIAAAEVLQGAARVRFLNRRVGDRHARQIGVGTGSLLILGITWLTLPWLAAPTHAARIGVGAIWLCLMLALDLYFGRVVFRAPWTRIAADFNPARGGLLGFGMLVLFLAPLLLGPLRDGP